MRTTVLLLALLLLAPPGQAAAAQAGAPFLPNGRALGVSVTRFTEALRLDPSITAVTFRQSTLRQNAVGLELNAGIFPQALPSALILTFDGGPGYDVSLPGATLVLRGGASGLVGLGGGALLVPGAHVGASALIRLESRAALRLDLLRHFYLNEGEFYPYWSLGFGLAVLSKPKGR
jgi:hypothetical protein